MGLGKTINKKFDKVKIQLAESGKNTTPSHGTHASIGSLGNMRPEDVLRQGKSSPAGNSHTQSKTDSFGNRPASNTGSHQIGPPVPPHTAPLNAASVVMNDANAEKRPQIPPRKPTVSQLPEDLTDSRPKPIDKQLPPLHPNLDSGLPLSESLVIGKDEDFEAQPHGQATVKDIGKTLGQAVDEQSTKIQEQARDIQALRESNYQHVAQLEKIKSDLQKEKEEHEKTKEKHAHVTQAWRKATAALSANRQEAIHKVDDDFLRAHYLNIVYEVSSWVATYCVSSFDHVPESELRVFNMITPHPRKYYHVKRTREILLQSLVMQLLVDTVLNFDRHGGLWWAGKHAAGLCLVQFAMEPDEPHVIPALLKNGTLQLAEVRDYSTWKAKTALLLAEKVNPPALENNVGCVLGEMQKFLKPFVQRTVSSAWKDLEAIMCKTIALDLEMNKSRALFQIHRWSAKTIGDMQFDETRMESPNGLQAARRGMEVELVLAPLITKTGNADGESFESVSLISPWTVVCYENRKQLQK